MDHIRFLLPQANASRGEGVEFTAAAVVAALNHVLRQYGYPEAQARAVSVTHQQAKITVSHGAVAGRILQNAEHIIEDVNTLIRQRFPSQTAAISRLFTKLG